MISTVLLLPKNLCDEANTMAETMNWGPNNFSVPLSSNGAEPITHWGLHAWTCPEFVVMVEAKTMPIELQEAGYTTENFEEVMNNLIYSFKNDYVDHFSTIINENNLKIIV